VSSISTIQTPAHPSLAGALVKLEDMKRKENQSIK
jgi:hypothetical protein